MSKGKHAELGTETVNANGYTWVKCVGEWRLKHHLVAEKRDGKSYPAKEFRISFANGNISDFTPSNIVVAPKRTAAKSTYYKRLHRVEEMMSLFVENSDDVGEALKDLKDALSNVRSSHGFAVLS